MNRAWAASISNFWHSANWPMWLAIIAVAAVAIVLVIAVWRSEGSLAKGGMILVSVLVIGVAAFVWTKSGRSPPVQTATAVSSPDVRRTTTPTTVVFQAPLPASLPALACLDGIAGESVEVACEKALFVTADSTAAAVSYTAAQITRLSSFGTAADADRMMTPDLRALRRSIERDRYGLVAQVLMMRDGCTSTACPFFVALTDTVLITGNMNERLYDGLVGRYSPMWNAVSQVSSAGPLAATGAVSVPTGKPLSGDFPSAASIPPVNIMTPEPAAQGAQSAPRPPEGNSASSQAPPPSAAKKKTNAQKSRAQAPTSLAPTRADDDN